MRLELDDQEMVNRDIMDLVEVQAKIQNSIGHADVKCVTSDRNAHKLVLRLEMTSAVVKNPTMLRQMEDAILGSVLTGMDGIGRVFVRTLKNEMIYEPTLGGYQTKDQYVLDLEGTNLYDLFVFPGVDMTRTFSNDIHEMNDVFGIETARLALYEALRGTMETRRRCLSMRVSATVRLRSHSRLRVRPGIRGTASATRAMTRTSCAPS
jgi:DNA-directed RNA polymerase beta' subunit